MEHVKVRRVTIRVHSPKLTVDIVRGVGFQATSDKEWRGPIRTLRQDAVRDMLERKAETAAP